jgi:hypothetical protein
LAGSCCRRAAQHGARSAPEVHGHGDEPQARHPGQGDPAATTGGDLRIAATARIHLARTLRGAGDERTARTLLEENDRWYRASGGGDGALLTRCLLAALSLEPGSGEAAVQDLHAVLDEARRHQDLETQTLALDDLDRFEARVAREAPLRR